MGTTTAAVERVAKDAKESAYCDDACYGRCRICPGQASKAAAALLLALAAERDALREAVQDATKLLESFYGDSGPGGSVYKILKAALVAMEKP